MTEVLRSPKISLRHVNKLKRVKLARQKKHDEKQALYAVMYSNPVEQLQYLDLQKARVELAQQQAELALTQAEVDRENKDAISRMAASGIKARKVNQEAPSKR
jgi:hypothetical protein